MALSERAQEILVNAGSYYTADFRIVDYIWRRKCHRTFYLYIILIMKQSSDSNVKTVLTITTGFIAIYFLAGWKWAIIIAFLVGLAGMFSKYLRKMIDFAWMKLAWILSLIIPNILLGIIFYLFLFPISVLSRLFGDKDPLKLKNKHSSLFINTTLSSPKESFRKPW